MTSHVSALGGVLQAPEDIGRWGRTGKCDGAFHAPLAPPGRPLFVRAVASLILWDPVVDGAAYLQELTHMHTSFMRQEMRCWRPSGLMGSEALGFPLSSDLKSEIRAVDLTGVKPPHARQVTVLTTNQKPWRERFRGAVAGWTDSTHWIEVTTTSPWNTDRALNAILVPMDVLDAIVARVQEMP